ncbi:MAG: hypothetical protein H2042_00525 [Rhizobiales bacterium]|nr:hypothetical protein [Hyphomicrobiales bacterium]
MTEERASRRLPGGTDRAGSKGVPRAAALLAGLPLAGCDAAGAPSLSFFGAYFPSWLACAFIGILGAVLVRVVLIRLAVDDALPARLFIYGCIAAAIGFLVSLLGFGR